MKQCSVSVHCLYFRIDCLAIIVLRFCLNKHAQTVAVRNMLSVERLRMVKN